MKKAINNADYGIDLSLIEPYLNEDRVCDVLINGTKSVYVERGGVMEPVEVRYPNEDAIQILAHQIATFCGRKIDPERPLLDARLPDGSRVNIISPPLAIDGTTISIRKFPEQRITLDTLVDFGSMTDQMSKFLALAAGNKINIVVSGGTGAGKTTLLNALSRHIPLKERIVTIEEAAELQLQQPHVVRLESKIPSRPDKYYEEVSIRDLVRNALRMRPDRIIVGEVRGSEAFDMMQAMNTGHNGSMCTIHANTPRDGVIRLENLINLAEMQLSQKFIRQQVAASVQLIVQAMRFPDGSRRVTHITEIVGLENETLVMQDLFLYVIKGEDKDGNLIGEHKWTSVMPRAKMLVWAAREAKLFGM